jgi:hypothetical protein
MFLLPSKDYRITRTKLKGRAVFARREIPVGAVIGDYLGTLMRPEDENEMRDGLYTMSPTGLYDILANPKEKGIHLINHSCSPNCGIYPYRGHTFYIATRRIFPGEEIVVDYMIGLGDKTEKNLPCYLHACHCGSKICTGSMHETETTYDDWNRLMKREFGDAIKKIPGKFGTQLKPLSHYPSAIQLDKIKEYQYNVFGSEKKTPITYPDTTLPTMIEIRGQIATTGKQLAFPKLHFTIYGIRNSMILGERK